VCMNSRMIFSSYRVSIICYSFRLTNIASQWDRHHFTLIASLLHYDLSCPQAASSKQKRLDTARRIKRYTLSRFFLLIPLGLEKPHVLSMYEQQSIKVASFLP
jgi:hypothetical protein